MEKLSRYESLRPFQPQPVANAAEGDAALAEAFGDVAKASVNEAATLMKEESNFNMMKASSEAHNHYTNAQIEMEKNPGMTPDIMNNLEKSFSTSSQYKMNKEDRARYDAFTSNLMDETRLKGAKYQIGVANLAASNLVYDTTTQQLKSLQELTSIGNLDQAENVATMIHDTADDAVNAGAISLNVYQNISKSVQEIVGSGTRFHQAFSQEGMTALDVHMANWSPLGTVHDVAELPSDYSTEHIANYLSEQKKIESLDHALITSEFEPQEFSADYWNMSSAAQREYVQKFMGIRAAYGRIASNQDFQSVEARMNDLEKNKEALTQTEKFELNYYQKLHRDLENGKFLEVISKTAAGSRAFRQYNAELAVKQQFPGSPTDNNEIQDPLNNLLDRTINIANASNMNPDYIRPIPQDMIVSMRGSFIPNGDPSVLVRNLKALNFSNRSYAANQFEDKSQREAVRMIAYGMDYGMTPEFMSASIKALQEDNKFESLTRGEKGVEKISDNVIKNKLNSELGSIINNLGIQKDTNRINGLIDYATRYVKQRAIENNDLEIKNLNKYVSEFSMNAEKSYNVAFSYNYSFNRTQHNLTNSEYSSLAAYSINKARANLRQGLSDVQFESVMSKTNLVATFNAYGDVVVLDDDGRSIYKEHYTDHLLSNAKREGYLLAPQELKRISKKVAIDTSTAKKYG